MKKLQTENFRLENDFKLEEFSELLWINDGNIKDISLKFLEKEGIEKIIPKDILQKIDLSWENLQKRAEATIPQNSIHKFFNSTILRFREHDENMKVEGKNLLQHISVDVDYKTITGGRNCDDIFKNIEHLRLTSSVVVSALITEDNKVVFGKREYYGDWPHNAYEAPGGFVTEKMAKDTTMTENAKTKICSDYTNIEGEDLQVFPFSVYHLPRVMETINLHVTKVNKKFEELESDFYKEYLVFENTEEDLRRVEKMDVKEFHPPTRVLIEMYRKNFDKAQELLRSVDRK